MPLLRYLPGPRRPRPLPEGPGRRRRRGAARTLAGLAAAALLPLTVTVPLAGAAMASPTHPAHQAASAAAAAGCSRAAGGVGCAPATFTPSFPAKTSKTFQVRQLVQCGSTMFAVGTFSQVIGYDTGHHAHTYSRNNVFSFHATWPFAVTSWNPNVNGEVNSIAVGGKNCSTAYLGGSFSKVHGRTVHNIAAVRTSTGAVLTAFRSNANNTVQTLLLHDSRLLTGGYFTKINGASRRFYVGLSSSTGIPNAYLQLAISGNYRFPGAVSNGTRVYNQQLSHDGTRMLVEGDFTRVGGKNRQQTFMLSLGQSRATVTGWTAAGTFQHCSTGEPFYIRAAAWGPTDRSVYLAATGYHPLNMPTGATPRTGLCDAASLFSSAPRLVNPTWHNYTGCDSLYSVVAGNGTVYIGGHERWASNKNDCDKQGPGAIPAPGLGGLSESNGALTFNPTRSRGLGADDLVLTRAGLWVASDNLDGSDMCAGVHGRAGICFLAY